MTHQKEKHIYSYQTDIESGTGMFTSDQWATISTVISGHSIWPRLNWSLFGRYAPEYVLRCRNWSVNCTLNVNWHKYQVNEYNVNFHLLRAVCTHCERCIIVKTVFLRYILPYPSVYLYILPVYYQYICIFLHWYNNM